MILRSILAVSALSLGATAFLVVPETHPHAVENAPAPHDLHRLEVHDARSEQVELTCDECPYPEVDSNGQISWTDGVKTSLKLNFSTKDNALFVNDDQVFPLPPAPLHVNAVQRRESDGQETAPTSLGFALEVLPLMPPQDDMELLSVRFTVLDLAGHPVPVDTVAVAVIKTAAGELFIAKTEIESTADDRLSWSQCGGEPRCLRRLLFARIQALITAAKARMMSVGAKLPFGGKGCRLPHHHDEHSADFGGDFPHHRPHHFGGHPHRHPHHRHGWRRTFSRVVRFIVVPAVLGVLAGLAASAIGMLVGQVIVFLWLRYRRCTSSRSSATLEQGSTMEKAALMEEDVPNEELPPYSDEDHVVPPSDPK
ncbi:hypothetical protein VTN77DRAFT_2990 [Rasamsonia byssochlamydoides]|uniref:uncharacterized protein n=1 Tax=Rasamsonia byssochlamydoides TaxID=89139 RepID=UPI0037445342